MRSAAASRKCFFGGVRVSSLNTRYTVPGVVRMVASMTLKPGSNNSVVGVKVTKSLVVVA
jgi:hypothetical protein